METPTDAAASSILIVDDDEDISRLLVATLRHDTQWPIVTASTTAEAKEHLAKRKFDVVITDISMPGEDGIDLMNWAREHAPGASWMVLTGHATVDSAVRALQLGAVDFFTKPIRSLLGIKNRVQGELEHRQLLGERDRLHESLEERNVQLQKNVQQLESACELLADQAETIRADLRRAALIQHALLPRVAPHIDGISVNALYRPSQNVGGDLYDVVRLNQRYLSVLIADAAGHGLSAAMLAVLFRSRLVLVDEDSGEPCRPSEALRAVNRSLADDVAATGLFITAAHCLVDLEEMRVYIASGGHPPLVLHRAGGAVERLMHTGPALGLYPNADFAEMEIGIEAGERLLLYTDGLYERTDVGDSPDHGVASAVKSSSQTGLELLQHLFGDSKTPHADEDDVTMVVIEVGPGPSEFDNGMLATAPPPKARSAARIEQLVAEEGDRTTISIRGQADWRHSAAFHERCADAIDSCRPLTLDLSLCRSLDSTFLGTIHELAGRAELLDAEFRIQGVMPPVESLFLELGMQTVMDHVVLTGLPLPSHMTPLDGSELDARAQAQHLLRAHQGLALINEQNLREFDPLVEVLRREVASQES
jgi:serine phosphatase RsbU (regulator of sigma subunit)/anti-anti-sigma regulatory factor